MVCRAGECVGSAGGGLSLRLASEICEFENSGQASQVSVSSRVEPCDDNTATT